jgi:hypothetical protein
MKEKQNTFRVKQAGDEKRGSLFSFLNRIPGMSMSEDGLPVQYLPYILFATALILFYIGNSHYAERKIRMIDKLQVEVEDLRADYTTLKAELMLQGKQSEVAKRVKPLGLVESKNPPHKIKVKKGEY